jgi:hypothetical protein
MRTVTTLVLLALAAPAVAVAQPVADVTVRLSPQLEKRAAEEHYGERDLARLAADLETRTEAALRRSGRLSGEGGRLDLVVEDLAPTRPTFEQLGRRPGLSYQSVYTGRIVVGGDYVAPDGARRELGYDYEGDIRWSKYGSTWSDAERGIDRFARKVARGDLPTRK